MRSTTWCAAATMFQFTHPGKGATLSEEELEEVQTFQFTHPGKGATLQKASQGCSAEVSIHAPWEGCDSIS